MITLGLGLCKKTCVFWVALRPGLLRVRVNIGLGLGLGLTQYDPVIGFTVLG